MENGLSPLIVVTVTVWGVGKQGIEGGVFTKKRTLF